MRRDVFLIVKELLCGPRVIYLDIKQTFHPAGQSRVDDLPRVELVFKAINRKMNKRYYFFMRHCKIAVCSPIELQETSCRGAHIRIDEV